MQLGPLLAFSAERYIDSVVKSVLIIFFTGFVCIMPMFGPTTYLAPSWGISQWCSTLQYLRYVCSDGVGAKERYTKDIYSSVHTISVQMTWPAIEDMNNKLL